MELRNDVWPVLSLKQQGRNVGKTKTSRLWVHAIDDRAHGGATKPAVWFARPIAEPNIRARC